MFSNNSTLPSTQTFETINRLSTVDTDLKKVLKLLQGLNSNKTHWYEGISIRILKVFGLSVIKPLTLLFGNCFSHGVFVNNWKKANIIPLHKLPNNKFCHITFTYCLLKDTQRLSTNLKTSNKSLKKCFLKCKSIYILKVYSILYTLI